MNIYDKHTHSCNWIMPTTFADAYTQHTYDCLTRANSMWVLQTFATKLFIHGTRLYKNREKKTNNLVQLMNVFMAVFFWVYHAHVRRQIDE